MNAVAFMRELVAKGMSWEDAAEIAERFQQSIEEHVAAALEAAMPKRSKAAERQAAYRERRRNGEHNAEHNGVTDSVANESDGDTRPLPSSPQTPQQPTPTRVCASSRTREAAGDFERFWAAYPLKKSKDAARKAWPRAIGRTTLDVMLSAIERQRTWDEWQRGFIPHPATWLNQARWDDEQSPAAVIPLKQPWPPHERPHHDAKFDARQANLARHERGADIAARQPRWKP